jgi:ankyrin repeat protein
VTLHELLDWHYGPDGDTTLRHRLEEGVEVDARHPETGETPLQVAVRRRRLEATRILLDHGAAVDAPTAGGKTAWTHAVRRGFGEIAELLADRGADTRLEPADAFAVAVVSGRLDDAADLLREQPDIVRTGNPEEDRLLADVAGRADVRPVRFLVEAGADLEARALDDGTPLHQAAWFGQPENARLLVEAGAPLDVFDRVHRASPLHWAVHGSRYSGDAEERQDAYCAVVSLLLEAGSALHYPDDPTGDAYLRRLRRDATDAVRVILPPVPGPGSGP